MDENTNPGQADGTQNPPNQPQSTPPAALTVMDGNPEEVLNLRKKLDEESQARKQREMRINELEDENRRLKTVTAPGTTTKQTGFAWTLLEEDEE